MIQNFCNKSFRWLSLALFSTIFFSNYCFGSTSKFSDKTFLNTRHIDANMPLEYTKWHNQIYLKPEMGKKNLWGTNLQVVGFYQKSDNRGPIGQYFGHYVSQNDDYRDFIKADNKTASDTTSKVSIGDIPTYFLLHNGDPTIDDAERAASVTIANKIQFAPTQESYGANFYFYQNLDKLIKKLFFKIKLPVLGVKNSFNSKTIGNQNTITRNGTAVSLYDVLSGSYEDTATDNSLQEKLKYAKINGHKSKAGLADIDITIGYDLIRCGDQHFGINAGFIIPTSNKPKAEYLFESIFGNAGHWAIRCGVDTKVNLYKKDNWKIDLLLVGDYKYFFKDKEKRTLGLNLGSSNFYTTFQHDPSFLIYYLAGRNSTDTDQALFPVANITTQDLNITPGQIFEGMADLAFNYKNFTIEFGYNLFVRGREGVSLKNSWTDDTYAVARPDFSTEDAFDVTDESMSAATINQTNLDMNSVITPSQITNAAFLSLGYAFNNIRCPIMIAAGTSYEYSDRNSALSTYTFWGKLGISF